MGKYGLEPCIGFQKDKDSENGVARFDHSEA